MLKLLMTSENIGIFLAGVFAGTGSVLGLFIAYRKAVWIEIPAGVTERVHEERLKAYESLNVELNLLLGEVKRITDDDKQTSSEEVERVLRRFVDNWHENSGRYSLFFGERLSSATTRLRIVTREMCGYKTTAITQTAETRCDNDVRMTDTASKRSDPADGEGVRLFQRWREEVIKHYGTLDQPVPRAGNAGWLSWRNRTETREPIVCSSAPGCSVLEVLRAQQRMEALLGRYNERRANSIDRSYEEQNSWWHQVRRCEHILRLELGTQHVDEMFDVASKRDYNAPP